MIGMAQAGTPYPVIGGVIGRHVAPEKRSWAMGIAAAAAGSFGQFLMVPTEGIPISFLGWQQALTALGLAALLIVPLAWGLREPGFAGGLGPKREQSIDQRMAKKTILVFIYFARAVVISVFLLAPLSPLSIAIFSGAIGLLWLSTVPPTNMAIAQIFGIQHLSLLSGFVFFSHQIGSFMGVWRGGFLHDRTGSYDVVCDITIALGIFAGLVNLPANENAIRRPDANPQPA